MSALTEKVAREHAVAWIGGSGMHERIGCECGARTEQTDDSPMLSSHVQHVAAVTEAAVRAAVAAEIDAYVESITEPWSDRMSHYLGGVYDARDIAEGKQS